MSDAGTQALMTALHGRLVKGVPVHKALRDSQLELLKDPQWSQPYIWSAFFMVER
ncbi:MAG: TPR repeat-containing protein [Rhodospirillaceae bacterium]|nr:MAG: TPR repeat-containing protein [Rhodospirillaceae bacterium]